MIEQYTIATTPKYNFPQPTIDTTLPKRLTQLSLNSLQQVQNNTIQLNQQQIQQIQNPDAYTQNFQLKPQPIQLKPNHEKTIVAAVDTSSIKIGETATGILVAIRGATVWKQNRKYRYLRLGPFIFHMTEENKNQVCAALRNTYLNTLNEPNHQSAPNLQQVPLRLASTLERWFQTMLTKTMANSTILFDGSLTSGTPDTPTALLKEILENARKRGNVVLAFSKMTTLRVNGHLITEALPNHKPPYLLETYGIKTKPPTLLLGDVYVAKLTCGNCAFRLDIDKHVPNEQKIRTVETLLTNDLLTQSYPETLRLAHILCTFTANEVIAMQHFLAKRHRLRIVNRPDMHRLLFGPFGKGENNA